MDKIKLEGKFIGYGNGEGLPAWIELSLPKLKAQLKPDLSQLKVKSGDRVWIDREIYKIDINGVWTMPPDKSKMGGSYDFVFYEDIIAHFPSEPEKKKVELPQKLILDREDMEDERTFKQALNDIIDVIREMKEK